MGSIVGGTLLILLDAYGIWKGRLPLKGRFDTTVDLAAYPEIFWAYSIGLGAIGFAAIVYGLIRRE